MNFHEISVTKQKFSANIASEKTVCNLMAICLSPNVLTASFLSELHMNMEINWIIAKMLKMEWN